MTNPTWTLADQAALDALNEKRQDYENAIRKPIDELAAKMHFRDMSEVELAGELVDHADELSAALEPFLIPTPKEDNKALEIGTATFDHDSRVPIVSMHVLNLPAGKYKMYIFEKDPS